MEGFVAMQFFDLVQQAKRDEADIKELPRELPIGDLSPQRSADSAMLSSDSAASQPAKKKPAKRKASDADDDADAAAPKRGRPAGSKNHNALPDVVITPQHRELFNRADGIRAFLGRFQPRNLTPVMERLEEWNQMCLPMLSSKDKVAMFRLYEETRSGDRKKAEFEQAERVWNESSDFGAIMEACIQLSGTAFSQIIRRLGTGEARTKFGIDPKNHPSCLTEWIQDMKKALSRKPASSN